MKLFKKKPPKRGSRLYVINTPWIMPLLTNDVHIGFSEFPRDVDFRIVASDLQYVEIEATSEEWQEDDATIQSFEIMKTPPKKDEYTVMLSLVLPAFKAEAAKYSPKLRRTINIVEKIIDQYLAGDLFPKEPKKPEEREDNA